MSMSGEIIDITNEMAFPKRIAEGRITGLGNSILDHLIKVLKWDNPQDENKHINDINNWIIQV